MVILYRGPGDTGSYCSVKDSVMHEDQTVPHTRTYNNSHEALPVLCGMTRPIDINVLLDKIGDSRGKSATIEDKDDKPKFLSRTERSNLLRRENKSLEIPFSTAQEDYQPIIDLQRPKRSRFEEDAEVTDNRAKNLTHGEIHNCPQHHPTQNEQNLSFSGINLRIH